MDITVFVGTIYNSCNKIGHLMTFIISDSLNYKEIYAIKGIIVNNNEELLILTHF